MYLPIYIYITKPAAGLGSLLSESPTRIWFLPQHLRRIYGNGLYSGRLGLVGRQCQVLLLTGTPVIIPRGGDLEKGLRCPGAIECVRCVLRRQPVERWRDVPTCIQYIYSYRRLSLLRLQLEDGASETSPGKARVH